MMKLLLTSSGITNQTLENTLVDLVGKAKDDIAFGIINEAYAVETDDKRWIINELEQLGSRFGGYIDLIDLLALKKELIAERFQKVDVIYVLGGHTDYLPHVYGLSGFRELLPDLLKQKVYVGSSAGSMVMGKRINAESYREVYGEERTYGTEGYLEFANLAIKPHFNSPWFPKNRADVMERIVSDMGDRLTFPLYAIDDQTAIKVVDGTIEIVSEGEWKIYQK